MIPDTHLYSMVISARIYNCHDDDVPLLVLAEPGVTVWVKGHTAVSRKLHLQSSVSVPYKTTDSIA